MALVAQPYRLVGVAVAGGINVSDYLTTIQTILAAVTYASGAARTPGAANAWSIETAEGAPVEALLLAPPTGSPASGKVLLAGYNGVKTPTMCTLNADAWVANCLLVGVSSNGGALSGWDGATPLGAVRYSGFWRSSMALGGAVGNVYVFESQEAVEVYYVNGTNVCGFRAGAIIDPLSTHALDAEADGRRYGMQVSGPAVTISTILNSLTSAYGSHYGSSNQLHSGVFEPGSATFVAASRKYITPQTTGAAHGVTSSSGRMLDPVIMRLGNYNADGYSLGTLRSVFNGPDSRLGLTPILDGVQHYPVGGSESADVDCYWLRGA